MKIWSADNNRVSTKSLLMTSTRPSSKNTKQCSIISPTNKSKEDMVLDKYILNDYPNPSFLQSNPRTSLQYTRIQHDRPNNLHKISALHEEDLSWCCLSGLYSIRKTEIENYIIMRPTIFLPFNSTSQSRIELWRKKRQRRRRTDKTTHDEFQDKTMHLRSFLCLYTTAFASILWSVVNFIQ